MEGSKRDDDTGVDAHDGTYNATSSAEISPVSESLQLMKLYTSSPSVVSHWLDKTLRALDLPFEVTHEEREVIQHERSTFVLGRSGTGKTTVMTLKMFQKELQHNLAWQGSTVATKTSGEVGMIEQDGAGSVLRQLFVSRSPKLCCAVKNYLNQLIRFAHGEVSSAETNSSELEDMDDKALLVDIPDSFMGIPKAKYPLVITFNTFLMMLDQSIGVSYFKRFLKARELRKKRIGGLKSLTLQTFIRTKKVTFERFCLSYWPHFDAKLRKNLDPSRVYTEIFSYIKCGFRKNGWSKLSRDEYVSLSKLRVSTLSAQSRLDIYDIFLRYENMKMENGEFDLTDLVLDLHLRLKTEILKGDKMDYVYIDEVQDLTMSQIALFRHICANVDEGFVFSGDTAQTIARGIHFRFEDIRSLFYHEFIMQSRNRLSRRREKRCISDTYNLIENFRTHDGVLKLAQSVVNLLYHFFPQFIDKLKPESSRLCGEAPVILQPCCHEKTIGSIFGGISNAGAKMVGYGAEQVILVRDDYTRIEVSHTMGKRALILTIWECKGLEFQDVFLYNFFGSSPLGDQWRLVYEYMEEQGLLGATDHEAFPNFNFAKHHVLCSELKQLYVAITRTRQRLWICENSVELLSPIFRYWMKLGLVQVRKVDDTFFKEIQVATSAQEWKERGVKLYWEKNYEMAAMCFGEAGVRFWEKLAKAAGLKEHANNIYHWSPDEAQMNLREAAELYASIGKSDCEAECFIDLGDYERAGRIYLTKCGGDKLKHAGECFRLARCFSDGGECFSQAGCYKEAGDCFGLGKCYKLAAESYAQGNYFSECLSVCVKGLLLDPGLSYVESWKARPSQDGYEVSQCQDICKMKQKFLGSLARKFHARKDTQSMMKCVRLFEGINIKRQFLKSLYYLDELLLLEEESGNYWEAAEIAYQMGNLLQASDLLETAGQLKEASSLKVLQVFVTSLWADGGCGWPLKQLKCNEELLMRVKSSSTSGDLCTDVDVLSHKETRLSLLKEQLSTSRIHQSLRGEFLSIRKVLDAHLQICPSRHTWENELPADPEKLSIERIAQDQVSAMTLVCFWDILKKMIIDLLEFIGGLSGNSYEDERLNDFCLSFFAVRIDSNSSDRYELLIPDAHWIKKFLHGSIREGKGLKSISRSAFVNAAQSYWKEELTSCSMKVLETLEALYRYSKTESLPVFHQSTCLIYVHEVTKFLLEGEFFDCKGHDEVAKVQQFHHLSMDYITNVFGLDCRKSLDRNMIALRKSQFSQDLLDDYICDNICGQHELTYGQLGRVMMICLGSGRLADELHKKLSQRLAKNAPWRDLFEEIIQNRETASSKGAFLRYLNLTNLLESSQKAIEYSFSTNWWDSDHFSPNCLLYIVDRLLLMASPWHGIFFTTRSSFIEWLIYEDFDCNQGVNLFPKVPLHVHHRIYDFVLYITQQILHFRHDTLEWNNRTNIERKSSLPVLEMRLVVILGLLCLNSDSYYGSLPEVLGEVNVSSQLPVEYYDILRQLTRKSTLDVTKVAKVFRKTGDPLVIVNLGSKPPDVVAPEAIFIDMGIRQHNDILDVLYPSETPAREGESAAAVSGESDFSMGCLLKGGDGGESSVSGFAEDISSAQRSVAQ